MTAFGGADLYFTEYFRVHATSNLEKEILRSVTANPTGRPVIAQMIGNDIPALIRTARELQQHPIVAVDLNLGCPAPVVYRKCAGGGLLREPRRVDAILGALRDVISIKFSVKTRIGFDSPGVFDELLPIFAKHSIDLLTVHGRTVQEMYRSEVHYSFIARAVQEVSCPVLANGNIYSPQKAQQVLQLTNARGLMIGRGAIRNPWLFHQIRQNWRSETVFIPTGHDVLNYLRALFEIVRPPQSKEGAHVQKMKKYLNYIGLGIEPSGQFLYQIRRATTEKEPRPKEPLYCIAVGALPYWSLVGDEADEDPSLDSIFVDSHQPTEPHDVTAPGQCRIRRAPLSEQQELHRVVGRFADSRERVDHEPSLALRGQDVLVMKVSVQENRRRVRYPQVPQELQRVVEQ
jgi:tRNA-dihydrouridine synthase